MSIQVDSDENIWFTETGVLNSKSFRVSVAVKKILHQEKSAFQNILLFDS